MNKYVRKLFFFSIFFIAVCDLYSAVKKPKGSMYFLSERPCKSGRKASCQMHEGNSYHQEAVKRFDNPQNKKKGTTPAERVLQALKDKAYPKVSKMLMIVHALAKQGLPMLQFTTQWALYEKMSGESLGDTYKNTAYANVFLKYVAKDAFVSLSHQVGQAKFASLTCDDSSDISSTEQTLWYVRICVKGKIESRFMGCASLQKADALSITQAGEQLVKQNLAVDPDTFFKKTLVGFTSDGANVMAGILTGVGTRLEKKAGKKILKMKCCAHQLELGVKKACEKCVLYKKGVYPALVQVFYFYHKSSLNKSNLRAMKGVIGKEVTVQRLNYIETRRKC